MNDFVLHQNYPNPFNPTTKIRFQISEVRGQKSVRRTPYGEVSHVTLKVYDVLGREVATLLEGELAAGEYSVPFSAERLTSGEYFYRLKVGNQVAARKMLLIR
jgi:hypothetical protein